jgi:HPt (histidine-containing phosphotransfer) domain-containing protein
MDEYISKPIKAQELQDLLQRIAVAGSSPTGWVDIALTPSSAEPPSGFDYSGGLAAMDQEIREIISQAFLDQWPQDLEKLRGGLERQDTIAVLHIVHSLKGTLSMFGAHPASEFAQRMESLAGQSETEAVAALLEPVRREVDQLLAVISVSLQTH